VSSKKEHGKSQAEPVIHDAAQSDAVRYLALPFVGDDGGLNSKPSLADTGAE
jgi:hypothetical protein